MNRPMKPIITLVAALAAVGTAIPVGAKPPGTEQFARFYHPVRLGPLTATPLKLIEDSRCPAEVNCIWAGRIVLDARIAGRGWRETRRLTLSETAISHGFRFALEDVEPIKRARKPISPAAYRFGFRFR